MRRALGRSVLLTTARDDIAYASNCAREIPYPPTGLPVWPES